MSHLLCVLRHDWGLWAVTTHTVKHSFVDATGKEISPSRVEENSVQARRCQRCGLTQYRRLGL